LFGAACGSDSKTDASKASSPAGASASLPSRQQCIDEAVAVLNAVDISGITIEDGLDDVEKEHVNAQADSIEREHPNLADGGPCETAYGKLTDEENATIAARVDPQILAIIREASQKKFDTVGSSIN
jgi:hypothetical protein